MERPTPGHTRWWLVVVFAIAMAWVEAGCVYYLRLLVDRILPYQTAPLAMRGNLQQVELAREAATLVMLLMVGALAGRTRQTRLAYTAIAFGVWDIFYYVFLRAICGWPASMFDWDILFLLPLPWWGPVLAPVCVATLMIVWGSLVTFSAVEAPASRGASTAWCLSGIGIALALYVFMADSLRAVRQGVDVRRVLPQAFSWPLFVIALVFMAAPIAHIVWRQSRT